MAGRAPPRLILEIDLGKLLPVGVAHDEAGVVEFFDGPRWWEAASGHYLFVCYVAGPSVGMPGEPVIIVGNPEHDCLSRALFYRSSKGTHHLSAANDLGHQPTGAALVGVGR